MIKRKLFKNDDAAYVVWFNEMQKTILVALFDEYGILIQEYQMCFMEYVFVPSGGIILLLQESVDNTSTL